MTQTTTPNTKDAFVIDMASKLMVAYVSKKITDKSQNMKVPDEVVKDCVKNAENLWEALYKHHP